MLIPRKGNNREQKKEKRETQVGNKQDDVEGSSSEQRSPKVDREWK